MAFDLIDLKAQSAEQLAILVASALAAWFLWNEIKKGHAKPAAQSDSAADLAGQAANLALLNSIFSPTGAQPSSTPATTTYSAPPAQTGTNPTTAPVGSSSSSGNSSVTQGAA